MSSYLSWISDSRFADIAASGNFASQKQPDLNITAREIASAVELLAGLYQIQASPQSFNVLLQESDGEMAPGGDPALTPLYPGGVPQGSPWPTDINSAHYVSYGVVLMNMFAGPCFFVSDRIENEAGNHHLPAPMNLMDVMQQLTSANSPARFKGCIQRLWQLSESDYAAYVSRLKPGFDPARASSEMSHFLTLVYGNTYSGARIPPQQVNYVPAPIVNLNPTLAQKVAAGVIAPN